MTPVENLFVMGLIVPGILVIMGLIDLVFAVVIFINIRSVSASKNWVSTTGTVSAAYMKQLSFSGKSGRSQTNIPVVEYSYSVGGQTYKNDRLYAGHAVGGDKRQITEDFLKNYPIGKHIVVFHNPNNPAESALHKNNPNVRGLIVGIVSTNLIVCLAMPAIWFLLQYFSK